MPNDTLIEIDDLRVGFPTQDDSWQSVIDGVDLQIGAGERVAMVGESGSGKSLTALACLGLVPEPGRVTGGTVRVTGNDVFAMSRNELAALRGKTIGLILQEAAGALNPVYTVGYQVAETVAVHRKIKTGDASQEALSLLAEAAIEEPEAIARCYPHQLSGGQAQRVMVAIALAGRPRLLIADEPTSALDSLTQAQIIELLHGLVASSGMGLLLISHDLAVVRNTVDRVAVMSAGRIVEDGPTNEVFSAPSHRATRDLLRPHRRPAPAGQDTEDANGHR